MVIMIASSLQIEFGCCKLVVMHICARGRTLHPHVTFQSSLGPRQGHEGHILLFEGGEARCHVGVEYFVLERTV